jgi:transcriptional regulator with GAF, ATPase, and Fis domain
LALRTRTGRFFTAGPLALLAGHEFPGNMRELRDIIERAVILARSRESTAEDPMLRSLPPLGARHLVSDVS